MTVHMTNAAIAARLQAAGLTNLVIAELTVASASHS